MSDRRPSIIGVTASTEIVRGAWRVRVNERYVAALEGAGALAAILPPSAATAAEAAAVVERLDGLLLTGGEDVDPARFGAERHPATEAPHAHRDATELALVAAARVRELPTLAICRGVQLLNVACGGTLVQDLPSERPGPIGHSQSERRTERVHEVRVADGSRLAAALGCRRLRVNSLHHQAVDRVGQGLRVTAHAPDGVVEGVETEDGWWALGVQWHPEELTADAEPWDRALFESFVAAARERRMTGVA